MHSFSCHSTSNCFLTSSAAWPIPFKSHSWTEFWISHNLVVTCQCLHLINCWICNQLNSYFLSHLANLLFINVRFWWKYSRRRYCQTCMYKYNGLLLYAERGLMKSRDKKRGSTFMTGRVDKQTVKPQACVYGRLLFSCWHFCKPN